MKEMKIQMSRGAQASLFLCGYIINADVQGISVPGSTMGLT